MKSPLCMLLLATFSLMAIASPPIGMGRTQVREDASWQETLQDESGKAVRRTFFLASPPMFIENTEGSPHKQAPSHLQVDRTSTSDDIKSLRALLPRFKEFNSASPTRLLDDPSIEDTGKIRMKRGLKKSTGGGYGGGNCCGSCGSCGGGKGGGGSYSSSQSSAQSSSSSGSYGGRK